jgi:hypothetical protein
MHSLSGLLYGQAKKPEQEGPLTLSQIKQFLHCKKKVSDYPVPDGMSLTKLSPWPGIISLLPARERLVRETSAGDGKIADLFLQCRNCLSAKGLGAPPVQAFLPVRTTTHSESE